MFWPPRPPRWRPTSIYERDAGPAPYGLVDLVQGCSSVGPRGVLPVCPAVPLVSYRLAGGQDPGRATYRSRAAAVQSTFVWTTASWPLMSSMGPREARRSGRLTRQTRRRRSWPLSVRTVVVATVLALLCNAAPGAYAAPGSSAGVLSGAGASSSGQALAQAVDVEVAPNGDHVFSLDISQPYDRASLQTAVTEANAQGVGVFSQRQLQAAYVAGPGAPSQDVRDVRATAAITDGGLQITVHPGDVTVDAGWWVNSAATAVGILVYLAVRSLCVATLTLSVAGMPAAVACAAVGGFVGSLTRSMILMAADKTYAEPKAWGIALLNAIVAAVGAAAWDAGLKAWATDTLPGLLKGLGESVKVMGDNVWRWYRTLGEFIRGGGQTLSDIAGYLPELARNLRATSQPPASTGANLRVMPVGDSITEGFNSTTGNGYREALERLEVAQQHPVDYVGSHRSGSMANSRNEGWSAQEIDFIQDKTMAHLKEYSPNVVTLLAGTNDIGNGREAGAAQRLVSFVAQIRATVPDAMVLVGGLLPDASADTAAAHRRFNDLVQLLLPAGDLAHLRFVAFDDLDPRGEMAGLHPNDSGYSSMASRWSATIDDLLAYGLIPPREAGGGGGSACIDLNTWYPQGTLTLGNGHSQDQVRLADLNGDGRDDYLTVNDDGSVDAYVNGGGKPGNWVWYDYGRIAGGVGAPGREVMFADINGDGRDDYLTVSDSGAVHLWINGGGIPGDWIWYDEGTIAGGVNKTIRAPQQSDRGELVQPAKYSLTFADLNGDGRDDYIVTTIDSGAAEAWLVGGDPFHPTLLPQGTVAWGAGPGGLPPEFANINCDHRADYLRISPSPGGAVMGYRNDGPAPQGGWSWAGPLDIAGGASRSPSSRVALADMNGDGRDDYLVVGVRGELTNVFLRG